MNFRFLGTLAFLVAAGGAAFVFAGFIVGSPRRHERVFLIVDDLDRCEPSQMLAVIESLRLFLDDVEMSRRMQVAMLIDRSILRHAIITRAGESKLLKEGDEGGAFFRSQEEKLFVVSLELPRLNAEEAKQLARKIVKLEEEGQAAERAVTKAIEDAGGKLRPAEPEGGSVAPTQQAEAGEKTSLQEPKAARPAGIGAPEGSPVPGDRGEAGEISKDKPPEPPIGGVVDVVFSKHECELLVKAAGNIPLQNLTPRTYRAFVLRYQLARLIIANLDKSHYYDPAQVVGLLASGLFGSQPPEGTIDPKVRAAVGCVLGNDEQGFR